MPETVDNVLKAEFEKHLQALVEKNGSGRFLQAVNDLITALDYKDEFLVSSSFNSLCEGLRGAAETIIDRELKLAEAMRAGILEFWDKWVDGSVSDDFELLHGGIESLIDKRLAVMTGFRDRAIKTLETLGYSVDNAHQLERGIVALQAWKHNIFKDWPSPSKLPSPLNRRTLSEVKEALDRGQKGLRREELIFPSNNNG